MADTEKNENSVTEWIKTIAYALILAGLIRTLFYQPFWIPSGSMKDTLLIGDFLFVNKMAYGYSAASCPTIAGVNLCGIVEGKKGRLLGGEPKRGDVVVFKHPATKADFIKRLIGLPGDRIQIKNGVLNINGEAVKIEPAGVFEEIKERQGPVGNIPSCENGPVAQGDVCTKTRSAETLPNGVVHNVLNIRDNSNGDDTGVFIVPEGQYFFMGDNRDNSSDSRFPRPYGVGFVPVENLVGRADRVIFSSAGRSILAFWTWRGDRFFKAIE
jgi:signal peptidase I